MPRHLKKPTCKARNEKQQLYASLIGLVVTDGDEVNVAKVHDLIMISNSSKITIVLVL